MYKYLLLVLLCFTTITEAAEPDQLDVIGLVPGATFEQYKSVVGRVIGTSSAPVIGGYLLGCYGKFKENSLEIFSCSTGSKFHPKASNFEIHETLKKGFSEKFGPPASDTNEPIRNRLGVEYSLNSVSWLDKQGNYLYLKNMDGQIDTGSLMLVSAKKMQETKDAVEQENKARKF